MFAKSTTSGSPRPAALRSRLKADNAPRDDEINQRFPKWLWLSALVIAIDQITKWAVFLGMEYHTMIPVLPFFSIVHVHNTGAAFSFLAGAGGWQRWFFLGIGIAASLLILHLLRKHRNEPLMALSLALILGGAAGNIFDRAWHGFVVDFLYFHYQTYAFPAFNIADSAITVGAGLLIYDSLRRKKT